MGLIRRIICFTLNLRDKYDVVSAAMSDYDLTFALSVVDSEIKKEYAEMQETLEGGFLSEIDRKLHQGRGKAKAFRGGKGAEREEIRKALQGAGLRRVCKASGK